MITLYIVIGVLLGGFFIFKAGGKELDRRLSMAGGLRKMYAPLVDYLLSKPRTVLLKNTPSRLVIVGQLDNGSYMWQISTPDGKKLTIRLTDKHGNQVVEKKDFDFPISIEWDSEDIIDTLLEQIVHKNILQPIIPNSNITQSTEQDNGIVNKFKVLIDRLQMKDSMNGNMFQISVTINCKDYYEFYIDMNYDKIKYSLFEKYGKLEVTLDSRTYIKGKWEFNSNMNQSDMADKIESDIDKMVMNFGKSHNSYDFNREFNS